MDYSLRNEVKEQLRKDLLQIRKFKQNFLSYYSSYYYAKEIKSVSFACISEKVKSVRASLRSYNDYFEKYNTFDETYFDFGDKIVIYKKVRFGEPRYINSWLSSVRVEPAVFSGTSYMTNSLRFSRFPNGVFLVRHELRRLS